MQVLKTQKELKGAITNLRGDKGLGLVPTMGALHQGHLSLVERALRQNDAVVVTIFVNPTQFNNAEDLEKYPKTLEADISLLKKASEDIIVFAPSTEEIYTTDIRSKKYDLNGLEKVMEGAFREGHFDGVGTIVETLLRMVEPDRAYFGEKDFQQLQIIKKLAKTKKIPVEIIGCPIVREPNGLAMSSRNERLSKSLRKEAAFIYKTLKAAKKRFGTESAKSVTDWVKKQFMGHRHLKLEYIQIANAETLTPVKRKSNQTKYRAFVAVYAGDVRLIDNIALN
ncbi:pantoate--beta-alanine ligase [Maribacter algicola]|uniref:Pantoate--beta-alanine ligase n=1 Tax=Meishania litoralis TaxID=3434685 RepID=A0ACC7LJ91_9FLAO